MLTVISKRDKVIQIEFNSSRFKTTDGLNNETSLAQVRRCDPVMTVRGYALRPALGYPDYENRGEKNTEASSPAITWTMFLTDWLLSSCRQ